MLSARLKDFLIQGNGIGNGSNKNEISEIKNLVDGYISDWNNNLQNFSFFETEIIEMHHRVSSIQKMYRSSGLNATIQKYTLANYKAICLKLALSVEKLSCCEDIAMFSDIVMEVLDSSSSLIPHTAKVFKLLRDVVVVVRKRLLEQFHNTVEQHLTICTTTEASSSPADLGIGNIWGVFLEKAKEWLLAYALVTLLPAALSQSKASIMDAYKEALDEALTPLWSRFHFQLSLARESHSFDQLLWTFGYAKSFAGLLSELCALITSSGRLQRLREGDYRAAGLDHVVDKTVRILRAHIANAIAVYSPLGDKHCSMLVEHAFQLDNMLLSLQPQPAAPAAKPLTATAVVFDAVEVFQHWLRIEEDYFRTAILEELDIKKDPEELFALDFGDNVYAEISRSSILKSGLTERDDDNSALLCYRAVYEVTRWAALASKRYAFFPAGAQNILSAKIVEPLLCIAVGLLILRIRSDPVLYAVSSGDSPVALLATAKDLRADNMDTGVQATTGRYTITANALRRSAFWRQYDPEEAVRRARTAVRIFVSSARYLQLSLEESCCRQLACVSIKLRFEKTWEAVQMWIPTRLISREELMMGTSALSSGSSLGSHYQSSGGGGGGGKSIPRRNCSASAMAKKAFSEGDAQIVDSGKVINDCWDHLGSAIDISRAQAIILGNVLEKRLSTG